MTTIVEKLTRYPVKGLSGQQLDQVRLKQGEGFPYDRQFGFARPNSGFDPARPKPLPKTKFYMLARDASLARLQTEFDENTQVLSLSSGDNNQHFDISTQSGKDDASRFLQTYLELPDNELPQMFEASPHRFTDVSVVSREMMNAVSIINLDSVEAFSKATRQQVHPIRFRGNILISGLPAFTELDLVDQPISIGDVHLKVVKRTKRCPATEVNPETAERDIQTPRQLQNHYGHMDMGVYAEVVAGGVIRPGDEVHFP